MLHPARRDIVAYALSATLATVLWGVSPAACVGACYFALLWTAARIDLASRVIPNALNLAIACLAGGALFAGLPFPSTITVSSRIAGMAVIGAPLACSRGLGADIGGGDVKLLASSGLLLGLPYGLLALVLGSAFGGIWAAILLVRGARRSDTFALGPMLTTGCALACACASPAVRTLLEHGAVL